MTQKNLSYDLDALLTAQEQGLELLHATPLDRAIVAGKYEEALKLWEEMEVGALEDAAKAGFASWMQTNNCKGLLNLSNVGGHPSARAALAYSLYVEARKEARESKGFTVPKAPMEAFELLEAVCQADRPSKQALWVLFELWNLGRRPDHWPERPLELAKRAAALYPDSPYMLYVHARELRYVGDMDEATAARLLDSIDMAYDSLLEEAYAWAMARNDRRLAVAVIDYVRANMVQGGGGELEMRFVAALTELALPESPDSRFEEVRKQLIECDAPAEGDDDRNSLEGILVLAALAARCGDAESFTRLARTVNAGIAAGELDIYSVPPFRRVPVELRGEQRLVEFMPALAIHGPVRTFRGDLEEAEHKTFAVIAALAARESSHATPGSLDTLVTDGPLYAPLPIAYLVGHQLLWDNDPYPEAFAALVVRIAGDAERQGKLRKDAPVLEALDMLAEPIDNAEPDVSSKTVQAIAARLKASNLTGEYLLRRHVLSETLKEENPQAHASICDVYRERTGQKPPQPLTPLQRVLADVPGPSACPDDPAELELVHAALLIALMRCEVDHAEWTVGPISSSTVPFEPHAPGTWKSTFLVKLFDLADMGVVGYSDRTPEGVLSLADDGRLRAHLHKVIWSISPQTLALHRKIRDMPRKDWPRSWKESAPLLARDLGTQELVAYLQFQCDQRGLTPPDEAELVALFKPFLESASVSKGYYLVHKSIRETLDYQAKYRPSPDRVVTRTLNLLRGNIERSGDWDTSYKRDRNLPESMVFSALHDVLTGWGSAAFEQPVFELPLG